MAVVFEMAARDRADSIALSRPRIGLSPANLIVSFVLRVGACPPACLSPSRN
jgi:hypothetical protein